MLSSAALLPPSRWLIRPPTSLYNSSTNDYPTPTYPHPHLLHQDAINEAMRDWVTNVRTTHYIIGTATGPHPFPTIVKDFQAVIGREARAQVRGHYCMG